MVNKNEIFCCSGKISMQFFKVYDKQNKILQYECYITMYAHCLSYVIVECLLKLYSQ